MAAGLGTGRPARIIGRVARAALPRLARRLLRHPAAAQREASVLQGGGQFGPAGSDDVARRRDLARKVAQIKPGAAVPVAIVRDSKAMDVQVKIGTMPGDPKMAAKSGADTSVEGSSLARLGVTVAPAEDGAGVVVREVDPNGAAAQRGLKEGDVILEIAGKQVNSAAEITGALRSADKKRVLMLVRSGDTQRFVALPIG